MENDETPVVLHRGVNRNIYLEKDSVSFANPRHVFPIAFSFSVVSAPMPKVAIRHIGVETHRAMVKWITPGTLTPTFVGSNPTSPAR